MDNCGTTSCSCSSSASTAGIWTPAIEELVAVGAAVGCNCIPCLKYHTEKAKELGVCDEDLIQAITIASKVKQHPAKLILEQADRLLGGQITKRVDPRACCSDRPREQNKCCG